MMRDLEFGDRANDPPKADPSAGARSTPHPVPPAERIMVIDVLRGIALFGVLWVNLLTEFRVSLFEHLLVFHTHAGTANAWIDLITTWLIEFKAFTVLSFLFGVGIAIQTERVVATGGHAAGFLLRRDAFLLLLGLGHMFLLWDGDILCLYAVCGMLSVALLKLPGRVLVAIAVALIALTFTPIAGRFIPSEVAMRAQVTASTPIYAQGTYRAIFALRWHEAIAFILPLLVDSLPKTLGLACLGIVAWRRGLLQCGSDQGPFLFRFFLVATGIGASMTSLIFWAAIRNRSLPWPSAVSDGLSYIPLALGLGAGLFCWLRQKSGFLIRLLAAFGQMALTNYIVQSAALGLVFYGYGGGLFGRLSPVQTIPIGLGLFAAQLLVSRVWLMKFRFGPLEWLWRSFAYGKVQPMLRPPAI